MKYPMFSTEASKWMTEQHKANIAASKAASPYEIIYDRETRDYAMYLDGELVGFARTYHEAECRLDEMVYDSGIHTARLTPAVTQAVEDFDPDFDDDLQCLEGNIESERREVTEKIRARYGNAAAERVEPPPTLPAVFTATATAPLDAMLSALSQAEVLINRLGEDVISQTDEVTVYWHGQPMTTVVVVVAPKPVEAEYKRVGTDIYRLHGTAYRFECTLAAWPISPAARAGKTYQEAA